MENTGQPPQASPFVEISADICQEQLPAPAAAVIRKGNITIEVTESASAGFIQKVMEALADAWYRKRAGNFYVLHKTCQHILSGVTSGILLFCSMASPCISHVNCSSVISRASCAVLGH